MRLSNIFDSVVFVYEKCKRLKDNFHCKYNLFLWAQFCGLGIVNELSVWSSLRAVLNGLTSVVVKFQVKKSLGYILSFVPLIWEVDIRCFGKRPFFSSFESSFQNVFANVNT